MFKCAAEFEGMASQVVEVTFEQQVKLPTDTEVGTSPRGAWQWLL
jgi:hypothetical protein